jgi:hypothetical protein
MDSERINPEFRSIIESHIEKTVNWEKNTYKLKPIDQWDHSKVPLIVAIPTVLKVDFSPMYVIMPDKGLISLWDENAFQRISAAYFPNPKDSDAKMLAFLAIHFGKWNQPIGRVIWTNVGDKVPKNKLRSKQEPTLRKKGKVTILEFYVMEGERLRISDCKVEINGEKTTFYAITY